MARRTGGDGWSLLSSNDDDGDSVPVESRAPGDHRIVVALSKRAKGKVVTVVRDLVLTPSDLKSLGKALKNACGTGGTAKGGVVELQGDCRDRARDWLQANGWG